jgi:mRNA interferase RelE/StbE
LAFKITYKASVAGDLRRLDKPVARRVLEKLEHVLAATPNAGIPLTGEFHGLFKFRVGDYRVIYTKTREGFLVLRIGHRKDVHNVK